MKTRINCFINGETRDNSQTNIEPEKTHIFADSLDSGVASAIKYETPVLVSYGDVRDVTLGPTGGVGESGCEFERRANSGAPICP